MKTFAKIMLAITVGALAFAPGVGAADGKSLGNKEFNENCVVCHGTGGTGNGSFAGMLTVAPADLTVLSKNNGGVFPFDRVSAVIDGRGEEKAHGPRDMPIWGIRYNIEASGYYADFYGAHDPEAFVHGRILALISYLDSLQKK